MKILLVQTGFLGDVVLSTVLIEALREIHPGAEIWMLTTSQAADIVRAIPELSGVITFDKGVKERGISGLIRKAAELKRHSFDAVYSLHKSYRTALLLWLSRIPKRIGFKQAALSWVYTEKKNRKGGHAVESNLSLLDADARAERFALRLVAPKKSEVKPEIATLVSGSAVIAVAPGSVWATKRWYWKHYRSVIQDLIARGERIVVVGSPAEAEICGAVCAGLEVDDLSGKLSLPELMFVIAHAKLLICNDSMPLHLASTFKVPTVAIFCATSPKFGFGPWRNLSRIVEKEGLSCKPCRAHGSKICPERTDACMKELEPLKVLSAATELLKESTARVAAR